MVNILINEKIENLRKELTHKNENSLNEVHNLLSIVTLAFRSNQIAFNEFETYVDILFELYDGLI